MKLAVLLEFPTIDLTQLESFDAGLLTEMWKVQKAKVVFAGKDLDELFQQAISKAIDAKMTATMEENDVDGGVTYVAYVDAGVTYVAYLPDSKRLFISYQVKVDYTETDAEPGEEYTDKFFIDDDGAFNAKLGFERVVSLEEEELDLTQFCKLAFPRLIR